MARKFIVQCPASPYHVSARCINREWFDIPLQDVWTIMEDYLYFISHAFGVEILSFVLMSNHFHLLIRQPRLNLSEAMRYFMRETSRSIGMRAGRINQTYGGRFFRSRIGSLHYYFHAYKYVYRNPLEVGYPHPAENYPYSTLRGLLGDAPQIIPVKEDTTLFGDISGTLNWLNTAPKKEHREAVRRALRKAEMEFTALNKKPNPLMFERY